MIILLYFISYLMSVDALYFIIIIIMKIMVIIGIVDD